MTPEEELKVYKKALKFACDEILDRRCEYYEHGSNFCKVNCELYSPCVNDCKFEEYFLQKARDDEWTIQI